MNKTNIIPGVIGLVLGALIIFFLFKIFKPSPVQVVGTKTDTVKVIEKYYMQAEKSTPAPQFVTVEKPVLIPQPYQPSADYAGLVKQYNELAGKFLSTKTYKDTLQLKDSAGNRLGVFNYNDVVNENEIKSRQPSYELSIPKTIITNTTTVMQPPVSKVYVMGEIIGTPSKNFINGANAGLMYQDKKDRITYLKAGGQYIGGTVQPSFSIGKAWKLKF